MKNPFKKNSPELDMDTATQMLGNVFDACNYEHNTVPIEVLSSYSNYRRERYGVQKRILISMMIIFLLLPLLFISPKLTVTPDSDNPTAKIYLSVSPSFVPVRRIVATLDGKNLPVYEVNAHQYIIQPTQNGKLDLEVTFVNQQVSNASCDVVDLDFDAPTLIASEMDDNTLYLYFSDEHSGVYAAGIRITEQGGTSVTDFNWNEEESCLSLSYPDVPTNVYVPDISGNTLHLLLTPQ